MNIQGFFLFKLIINQGLFFGYFFYIYFEGYVGVVEFYFYFKCFVQQRNVDIVFDVGVGGGYSIQGLVSYGGQRCLYGFRVI